MNRAHIIRDTLSRLIDDIHAAEEIDEDGMPVLDYGEVMSATLKAQQVLARSEEP